MEDWKDDEYRRWFLRGMPHYFSTEERSLLGFGRHSVELGSKETVDLSDGLAKIYARLNYLQQDDFRYGLMRAGLELSLDRPEVAEACMHVIFDLGRRLPAPEVCRVVESRILSVTYLTARPRMLRAALYAMVANCKTDGVDRLLLHYLELPEKYQTREDCTVVFRALVAARPSNLAKYESLLRGEFAVLNRERRVLLMWRDVEKIVGTPLFKSFLDSLKGDASYVKNMITRDRMAAQLTPVTFTKPAPTKSGEAGKVYRESVPDQDDIRSKIERLFEETEPA